MNDEYPNFSVFALTYLSALLTLCFYSSLISMKAALTSPLLNRSVNKSNASSIFLKASVNSVVVSTNDSCYVFLAASASLND